MNKKKLFVALAVATALTVPFSVYAATSDAKAAKNIRGFFGIDASKLTDTQKEDMKAYSQKMADLQKEFINKMVENGSMTKEQGDAAINRIDEGVKNGAESGYIPGFNFGKGDFDRHGKAGGFGVGGIDTSKLTEEQKADLKATYTKIMALQKDLVSKAVSAGIITSEQGTAATAKIDELAKNIESGNFSNGLFMGKGGFGLLGVKGFNSSSLTDAQKAIFTDFSKSLTELQKELINKLVANGTMTKEQGDAAIKRLESADNAAIKQGFPKDRKMDKSRFNGKLNKEKANTAPSSTTQAGT